MHTGNLLPIIIVVRLFYLKSIRLANREMGRGIALNTQFPGKLENHPHPHFSPVPLDERSGDGQRAIANDLYGMALGREDAQI
jgi:hypothetical protein